MKDEQLRELEQLAKNDPRARYDYRRLCVRIGKPEKAGYHVGDLVLVEEQIFPWIRGPWQGQVTELCHCHIQRQRPGYIRPLSEVQKWEANADQKMIQRGLTIDCFNDKITLLEPYNPQAQP